MQPIINRQDIVKVDPSNLKVVIQPEVEMRQPSRTDPVKDPRQEDKGTEASAPKINQFLPQNVVSLKPAQKPLMPRPPSLVPPLPPLPPVRPPTTQDCRAERLRAERAEKRYRDLVEAQNTGLFNRSRKLVRNINRGYEQVADSMDFMEEGRLHDMQGFPNLGESTSKGLAVLVGAIAVLAIIGRIE